MKYRQLVDDQRVRFVEDTSARVFSSCARLIALAPVGETEDARVVEITFKRPPAACRQPEGDSNGNS